MRFCQYCGAELNGAPFCSTCGTPAASGTGQTPPQATEALMPATAAASHLPPPAALQTIASPHVPPYPPLAAATSSPARRRPMLWAGLAAATAAAIAVVATLNLTGGPSPAAALPAARPADSTPTGGTPTGGTPTAGTPEPAAATTCTYLPAPPAARPVHTPPARASLPPTTVTMTTNVGTVTFALDVTGAPCASNALVDLARQHYFDGTPCHRLTTEGIFVLQCGDPTGTGRGGPGYRYAEESLSGATYKRGTVAMAKSGDPVTTGSQFFFVYADATVDLPPEYTVVGHISSGLEVLDRVAAAGAAPPNTTDGAPNQPVQISGMTATG